MIVTLYHATLEEPAEYYYTDPTCCYLCGQKHDADHEFYTWQSAYNGETVCIDQCLDRSRAEEYKIVLIDLVQQKFAELDRAMNQFYHLYGRIDHEAAFMHARHPEEAVNALGDYVRELEQDKVQ